jgi:hypothetical protein
MFQMADGLSRSIKLITSNLSDMKNKILTLVSFMLAAIWLLPSCETDMEKAQNAYTASQVIPSVISATGPTLALATKVYTYKITYDRAGSTWAWTAVGATIQSVSTDKKTATVLFTTVPANDTALIKVTETTSGGVTSPEKVFKVRVNPFCALATSGFVGTWTGTDGQGADYTYSSTVTATLSGEQILLDGVNVGFMSDFWAENIVTGGTCLITINDDGTVLLSEQYFCDTDYSDGYKIKGTGTWDNCGAKPTLKINYDIWYPDSNYWIAAHYKSYLDGIDHLTLTLTKN